MPFRAAADSARRARRRVRWRRWLVDDQREASGRPDVVAFTSDVLTAPTEDQRHSPSPNLDRLHERHRRGLGGEADRRLSRRSAGQPGMGGYQLMVSRRHLPRPLSRERRDGQAHRGQRAAALSVRAAHREPRLPARPSAHGADPVELVSALRPQPADVRAEHLLGQGRGLPEGRAEGVSRARAGELHRAAAGRRYRELARVHTGSRGRRAMATVTLKNVSEELVRRIKGEAKRNRRSLNQELLVRLESTVEAPRRSGRDTVKALRRLHKSLAGMAPLTDAFLNRAKNEGRS